MWQRLKGEGNHVAGAVADSVGMKIDLPGNGDAVLLFGSADILEADAQPKRI